MEVAGVEPASEALLTLPGTSSAHNPWAGVETFGLRQLLSVRERGPVALTFSHYAVDYTRQRLARSICLTPRVRGLLDLESRREALFEVCEVVGTCACVPYKGRFHAHDASLIARTSSKPIHPQRYVFGSVYLCYLVNRFFKDGGSGGIRTHGPGGLRFSKPVQ